MFIGHFAIGLASKRAAPGASLGWLIAAPLLLDLLWPIFLLAGREEVRIDPGNTAFTPLAFVHYPISHSMATAAGWSVLLALLYQALARYRAGAMVIGAGVFSHWVFDAVTHRPDLPLWPGSSTFVGCGLWNSVAGTLVTESLLFAAGIWLYAATTRARDRAGIYGFWLFVGCLAILYVGNATGPPPPSIATLEVIGLCAWIFPFWGWWFDRHRAVTTTVPPAASP